MSYHKFIDSEGQEYGSFEVFKFQAGDDESGWYWWACHPGCLPDSEPTGPFNTEKEAYDDARDF